jgi:hypothetical protein
MLRPDEKRSHREEQMHHIGKRDFLAGLGMAAAATLASAQPLKKAPSPRGDNTLPNRMAKTTKLFKAPALYPNGMAVAPEGLWLAQQHLTEGEAKGAGAPMMTGKEALWLMDWDGKLIKTLHSDASNTSGLAHGGGSLWAMANTTDASTGVHQVDLASGRQVAHRQIPLSPGNVSGGIHGAQWHDGKLWIVNNRMHSLIRIDTRTWTPEVQIPIFTPPGMERYHDITFDKDGTILQVIANNSTGEHDTKAGLVRYNAQTGAPIETITFVEGACDPHGLELHNGMLISCNAGYHPGWKDRESASSGWVFSIELI